MSKVKISVDARDASERLPHSWRYIGYDECNYTQAPEGRELLAKFGGLERYYVRAHHMLCTGNGRGEFKWGSTNAYIEDERGDPVYGWACIDEILDIYLERGCTPFFELGFMPMDLVDPACAPAGYSPKDFNDYKRYGWACPPKDYGKWGELVRRLVEHCVHRYGRTEVLAWYWELWNEPDIFYWRGGLENFCKLYDFTEGAVHSVLPEARLGGPSVTGPLPGSRALQFLEDFLDHCIEGTNFVTGGKGTRLDFITFHAKGGGFTFDPKAGKLCPSVRSLMRQIETGLECVLRHGLGRLEIVLSEADPDGWAAGGVYDNPNMVFRNTEYYASYIASSYHHIDKLARRTGTDVRPLAWAFTFVGERCFEGTRAFATQGIEKPVFNLFKMLSRTGTVRLPFASSQEKDLLAGKVDFVEGEEPEVSGFASLGEDGRIDILVYSHHDDRDLRMDLEVELEISCLPRDGEILVRHFKIDGSHGNAYAEWLKQGSPNYPNPEQYRAIKLKEGLELYEPERRSAVDRGLLSLRFSTPAHSVSLIEVSGI